MRGRQRGRLEQPSGITTFPQHDKHMLRPLEYTEGTAHSEIFAFWNLFCGGRTMVCLLRVVSQKKKT